MYGLTIDSVTCKHSKGVKYTYSHRKWQSNSAVCVTELLNVQVD